MPHTINDGLNKWQRYRLKDLEKYRKLKREYAKTPAQREKRNEYMRLWRNKNRARHNELSRESHMRNRWKHVEEIREYNLIKKYGITQKIYLELLEKQHGVCYICGSKPNKKSLHVDHSHESGKVRGLLCSKCNGALGWLEKNIKKIKEYQNKNSMLE